MSSSTNFRIHLVGLAFMLVVAPIAWGIGEERFDAALQEYRWLELSYFGLLIVWGLTALFMYVHSWFMLVRGWKYRPTGESLKLLILLWFFSYFTAFYFYLKRYEIDARAA